MVSKIRDGVLPISLINKAILTPSGVVISDIDSARLMSNLFAIKNSGEFMFK